jgi:hypothetical protein
MVDKEPPKVISEPRWVSRLDSDSGRQRERLQRRGQPTEIGRHVGRELDEYRS